MCVCTWLSAGRGAENAPPSLKGLEGGPSGRKASRHHQSALLRGPPLQLTAAGRRRERGGARRESSVLPKEKRKGGGGGKGEGAGSPARLPGPVRKQRRVRTRAGRQAGRRGKVPGATARGVTSGRHSSAPTHERRSQRTNPRASFHVPCVPASRPGQSREGRLGRVFCVFLPQRRPPRGAALALSDGGRAVGRETDKCKEAASPASRSEHRALERTQKTGGGRARGLTGGRGAARSARAATTSTADSCERARESREREAAAAATHARTQASTDWPRRPPTPLRFARLAQTPALAEGPWQTPCTARLARPRQPASKQAGAPRRRAADEQAGPLPPPRAQQWERPPRRGSGAAGRPLWHPPKRKRFVGAAAGDKLLRGGVLSSTEREGGRDGSSAGRGQP